MKDFFAEETIKRFDYILGKPIAEALSEQVESGNEQGIMNREVDELVRLIETTPIDVYAGVMLMRTGFRSSADILWTDERMQRVIAAAAKHGVAFEINLRERTPSEKFVKLAKAAKVKFTFGSDTITAENYGDWPYALEMQKAAGLTWRDMWVPGHAPTRAQRELKKP
jgi:histidinol phosphatase-like PHP family hydrolase